MKWNIGNAKGVNKNGHNRINKKQAETGFNKCSKNLLGILEKQEQGLLEITVPKKDRFLNLWGKAAAEPNQPFYSFSNFPYTQNPSLYHPIRGSTNKSNVEERRTFPCKPR